MHPRWSQGPAIGGLHAGQAREPGPASRRAAALLRLAVLVAAVTLTAAGCSSHPAAAAHRATRCGTARTYANVPVKVEVTRGKVACPAALTVERSYTKAMAQGQAPGNGGGGPLDVGGWKCQGFPTPVVLKTGWASKCVRGGTEILAILPPPSSS